MTAVIIMYLLIQQTFIEYLLAARPLLGAQDMQNHTLVPRGVQNLLGKTEKHINGYTLVHWKEAASGQNWHPRQAWVSAPGTWKVPEEG